MTDVVAGIDIGGTKISLVLATLSGETIHRSVEPTDSLTGTIELTDDLVTYFGLAEQLERMLTQALVKIDESHLKAIGVVSAGPIRDGGLWNPPNIVPPAIPASHRASPRSMPLVAPLKKSFDCPVDLLNDCSAAVLGEVFFGLGKNVADKSSLHLAYATISTGFGVGAWTEGRLILGKDGNAGELGHVFVRKNGLRCGCGNHGCAEAYCSGTGIASNARARLFDLADVEQGAPELYRLALEEHGPLPSSRPPLDAVLQSITPTRVFEAAAAKDPLSLAVIDDAIFAGGIAFAAIACAYDPEFISVGGGIALAHPELLEPIETEMRAHLNVRAPKVCITPLGSEIADQGAIAIAQRLLQR
jgi:glucokinase